MPEGLLYRGKYAGQSGTRNCNFKTQENDGNEGKMTRSMKNVSSTLHVNNRRLSERGYNVNNPISHQGGRNRPQSSRVNTMETPNKLKVRQMKKYFPEEYFKRVGYKYSPS